MAVEEILNEEVDALKDEKHPDHEKRIGLGHILETSISPSSLDGATQEGEIFSMGEVDAALDAKMRLLNRVSHPSISMHQDVPKLTPFSRQ
jgi:hypothetical protein